MPRRDISMTDVEIRSFLAEHDAVVIATLDETGRPRGGLGRYRLDGADLVVDPADAAQLADVARDPRVCCIVEQFPSYHEIRAVMAHGRAEPAEGGRALRVPLTDVVSFDFGKLQA